jgi:hypothetical protein
VDATPHLDAIPLSITFIYNIIYRKCTANSHALSQQHIVWMAEKEPTTWCACTRSGSTSDTPILLLFVTNAIINRIGAMVPLTGPLFVFLLVKNTTKFLITGILLNAEVCNKIIINPHASAHVTFFSVIGTSYWDNNYNISKCQCVHQDTCQ